MLIAVILWALVLGSVAAIVISLFGRAQRSRAALALMLLAALAELTPWVQLGLAWAAETFVARRMIATTFFYPPPSWLAPAIGIPLGIGVAFVTIFRKRRVPAGSA